jgi:2-phosphoglycolate phosphatase
MTILFDLDGTLLDTGPDFLITLNTMLSEDKRPNIEYELLRPFINLGTSKMLEIAYQSPPDDMLRKRFLAIYQSLNLRNTSLFPGIMDMLTNLEASYNLGLVTNKSTKLTLIALRRFGIQKLFKSVVCGDTLAVKKPSPEPLLLAAQQLRCQPSSCVFIGDAVTDIIAGKAANMRTILVTFGYVPDDHTIIQGWQADALANSTKELTQQIKQWM